MDNDQAFQQAGQDLLRYICQYNEQLRDKQLPVLPSVQPGYLRGLLPAQAPEKAESFEQVLQDVREKIMPGVTHWHHPNFFAYYPTSTSYASTLGDMLSGTIACIGFSWIASPACTELEVICLDWLVTAMGLPERFLFSRGLGGGVIKTSASDASLMMVLALRSWHCNRLRSQLDTSNDALAVSRMVVYHSDQAHSSIERACRIGLVQQRVIETLPGDGYRMCPMRLAKAMDEDLAKGLQPILCFATMGTTNSCTFDDLEAIAQVCHRPDRAQVWCHVDAAYAGAALICEEFRSLAKGVDQVDSFNYNPHKMQRVAFDCSVLWVRDRSLLESSFEVQPTYLQDDHNQSGANPNYMPEYRHWQVPLGRRFRALKLWFVLRLIGLQGLRDYWRKHCQLARLFESLLRKDSRFQVVNEVEMGLVCFRLFNSDRATKLLNEKLLAGREIFLVPGSFKRSLTGETDDGFYFLRFVVGSHLAQDEDVHHAFNVISCSATQITI